MTRLAATDEPTREKPGERDHTDPSVALAELTTQIVMVFGRMKRVAMEVQDYAVLPGTELSILDTILRHGCRTVPDIASWRGVRRQSVQALVNKLVDSGLLTFSDNPNHKVSRYLELTEKGLERYRDIRGRLVASYQPFAEGLSERDLEGARRVLAVMAVAFDIRD
jgi:DNA-binding MarR family transcriptional regulator